jgi:hypothetical protein
MPTMKAQSPAPVLMHRDLQKRVAATQNEKWPCILCGAPTYNRGAFEPHRPGEHGEGTPAEGKDRIIVYAVCNNHKRTPMVLIAIEQAIHDLLTRQARDNRPDENTGRGPTTDA